MVGDGGQDFKRCDSDENPQNQLQERRELIEKIFDKIEDSLHKTIPYGVQEDSPRRLTLTLVEVVDR
tara:strand:+ start:2345 stop:2545 length:201 start_codon:yes stop_codon:yes gene_type:complete